MSKKNLIYLSVVILTIALFLGWYYQPERVVKRRVLSLITSLSVPPDSGRTARLMKAGQITNYLADEVEFDTPFEEVAGMISREDLCSSYQFIAEKAQSIIIEPNEEMAVKVHHDRAEVKMDLHAEVKMGSWGTPVNGTYTIELWWEKSEDGWTITKSRWKKVAGR